MSFSKHIAPIFADVFDSVRGVVDVAAMRGGMRVVPGDPQESVLYPRTHPALIPDSLAPLMPKHSPRLTPGEIELIREWTAEGARNN